MDYYEELGISRSASIDEVRQAHRNLARLLHPDQYPDPVLKRLAEGQMKRINRICALLSDPRQRRMYDLGLAEAGELPPPAPPPRPRPAWRRYAPGVLGTVALALMVYWLAGTGNSTRPPVREDAAAPVAKPAPASPEARTPPPASPEPGRAEGTATPEEVHELRRRLGALEREKSELAARAAQLEARNRELELARAAAKAEIRIPPALPPAPAPTEPARQAAAPPPTPRSRLAGSWFYLRPARPATVKDLYPPEYIEIAIIEDQGRLRGRYRARYQVADRAISPDVAFDFEGAPEKDSAHLPWSGAGGAHGEVSLRLVSENSLEVRWSAIELGRHMGLSAGSAVLVRWREP